MRYRESWLELCCLVLWASAVSADSFRLTSPAFNDNTVLPIRYTCYGSALSPPLQWSDPPAGTKSLVLLVTDPDAPYGIGRSGNGNFYHWGLYNMPPRSGSLAEDVGENVPDGVQTVTNDAETSDFHPACPPMGEHRYIFTLYAMDKRYSLKEDASAEQLHDMFADPGSPDFRHVLGTSSLTGRYRH